MTTTPTRTYRAGVHQDSTATDVARQWPGATAGRVFIPGAPTPVQDLRPLIDQATAPWLTAGGGCYVSYKPSPTAVAAGGWTGHHRQLGAWLADHPSVAVIVWHEPSDDVPTTFKSAAAYAAMFNRCRQEIKAGWVGARVVYCDQTYNWRPHGTAATAATGWQHITADEYLADVYSGRSFPAAAILPEHAGFTGWYQAIVAARLNRGEAVTWGLAERGFEASDPAVRAATIRREDAWLRQQRAIYNRTGDHIAYPPALYLAWNTPGVEGDRGWLLTDQASQTAMGALIAGFAS